MKKIYLISTSQATCRGVKEGENYPSLLQVMLPDYQWHFLILDGGSIREFNNNIESVLLVKPDLAILQIGIVDCARRILTERQKNLLKNLPLGWIISKTLHDHRQTTIKWRHRLNMDYRKVTPTVFRQEMNDLTAVLTQHAIKCLFLEIPRFDFQYEQKYYPFINEDVSSYNKIIREFHCVPIFPQGSDLYSIWQPGTVHFNQEGHRRVAERIKELIVEADSSS